LPIVPLAKEGAERRQALGCLRGTRSRASNVGPQGEIARPCVPAQPAYASHAAGGRSPLGAPPRRFVGPRPAWRNGRAFALRCRVAAFAGPARSGGRAVLAGRLPGVVVTSQPAGRRIPLRLWLVSGDALGERDRTYIGAAWNGVKDIIPITTRY